jgi:hypothetical protein
VKNTIALLLFGLLPLGAQDVKFPESFEKLAAKAKESVNVSLDGTMLQLAGNFLSNRNAGEAKAKQLSAELKGIYVRTFEFEKEGEYTDADVAPVRSQLTSARGWSSMVNISEPGERVEVYAKKEGDRVVGMTVMVSEKKALTVVYVDGPIDLSQLGDLVRKNINVKVDVGKPGKE